MPGIITKIIVIWILTVNLVFAQEKYNLMIVTGGHDFDRKEFFGMFDQFAEVKYVEFQQPRANEAIESGNLEAFDLLVFYDMYDSITVGQKDAYYKLFEEQKPMLFLHHSLVSYQDWPEFIRILGGKYHTRDSSRLSHYKHDEIIEVQIKDKTNPVTSGLSDFTLIDETYGNCEILPTVTPLLTTDHELSMPVIGWINQYLGHEIIYLQGGHGPSAFRDKNFQQILYNAIQYCINN